MGPRGPADAVRAIVFDFDGLLMDTESTSLRGWQFEWGQWGLTLWHTAKSCMSDSIWRTGCEAGSTRRPAWACGARLLPLRLAAGDEVGQHKPAPDVYLLALGRLSVSGDAAVAVEDTAHGVAAALRRLS